MVENCHLLGKLGMFFLKRENETDRFPHIKFIVGMST